MKIEKVDTSLPCALNFRPLSLRESVTGGECRYCTEIRRQWTTVERTLIRRSKRPLKLMLFAMLFTYWRGDTKQKQSSLIRPEIQKQGAAPFDPSQVRAHRSLSAEKGCRICRKLRRGIVLELKASRLQRCQHISRPSSFRLAVSIPSIRLTTLHHHARPQCRRFVQARSHRLAC